MREDELAERLVEEPQLGRAADQAAAEEAAQDAAAELHAEAVTGYRNQLAGHRRYGSFLGWPDFWARTLAGYWDRVWRRLALAGLLAYFSQAPDDESDDQDDSGDDGT